MTQQPMQYPQQPYQPQQPQAYPQAPAPYQQQYPPQPMPPQGYPQQQYQAPPQAPAVPLAEGSLDAFYAQPSVGGGPSLSWSSNGQQKPLGTTYVGVVAQDITSTHVQQETDQQSNQPKFYRDGRPKFVMKLPLERVQGNYQTPTGASEFSDGEATWWVKGQGRDELTRAMAEAGVMGAPKKGAVIQITLTDRKAGKAGMNPANIVQVVYTPAGTEQRIDGGQPSQAQAPQHQAPQHQAPQHQAQTTIPQGYAPTPGQEAHQIQPQPPIQPPATAPAPMAPQPPAGMTPEAAAILQNLGVQQG